MATGFSDTDRQAIVDVLSKTESVQAAYLFGSAAAGNMGPLSDIDIGVLVAFAEASEAARGRIEESLCRALHADRLDVVLLNRAPSALAYRVIRDGIVLCCSDSKAREAFESRIVMDYLDFQPLRRQAFQTARQHILGAA